MKMRAYAAIVAALLLSACASTPGRIDDPLEPMNRAMYAINKPIDDHVMRPIAQAYLDYVPALIRQGISNEFGNIDDFFSGINGLLQNKPENSVVTGSACRSRRRCAKLWRKKSIAAFSAI